MEEQFLKEYEVSTALVADVQQYIFKRIGENTHICLPVCALDYLRKAGSFCKGPDFNMFARAQDF